MKLKKFQKDIIKEVKVLSIIGLIFFLLVWINGTLLEALFVYICFEVMTIGICLMDFFDENSIGNRYVFKNNR